MSMASSPKNVLADDAVRSLVLARLAVLSSETIISLGSEGSFNRDELLDSVRKRLPVGEKLAEIQLEWLRSFKQEILR